MYITSINQCVNAMCLDSLKMQQACPGADANEPSKLTPISVAATYTGPLLSSPDVTIGL